MSQFVYDTYLHAYSIGRYANFFGSPIFLNNGATSIFNRTTKYYLKKRTNRWRSPRWRCGPQPRGGSWWVHRLRSSSKYAQIKMTNIDKISQSISVKRSAIFEFLGQARKRELVNSVSWRRKLENMWNVLELRREPCFSNSWTVFIYFFQIVLSIIRCFTVFFSHQINTKTLVSCCFQYAGLPCKQAEANGILETQTTHASIPNPLRRVEQG